MSVAPKLSADGMNRIVVFRALQLGDLLCTVPAFRALRMAYPDAQITLIGLPWAKEFVKRFDFYLDDFIEFPGFPGFPEQKPQVARIPDFLKEVQWLEFDLGIQMQGSGGVSNSLVELFGARRNAGFYLPGQYNPDEELFFPYPAQEPEIWRHLRLMEHLGVETQGPELEFPLYRPDREELAHLEQVYGLKPGEYACVHPGSRSQARRWPVERFARVADGLAERGLKVILTGSQHEAPLTAAVAAHMHTPAVNLAGKTSLGGVGALLSGSRLLVSNDTGVSHVAAALRTPSVILFSASDPNRWAPLDTQLHRSLAWATAIGPELVLAEVDSVLKNEHVAVR